VNVVDSLNGFWNTILDIAKMFVIPDWSSVVGLLPLMIFLGVVGPLVTFTVLGVFIYQVAKPRTKVTVEEGPEVARIGADGKPIFPPGLPYCRVDGLIYPSGTIRCERDGKHQLSVICPMCSLGRPAAIDTCTNCGLVLKVKPRPVTIAPATGPKPGGAAAA
jgi:hypothetical protein